jgi:hypothetical protein
MSLHRVDADGAHLASLSPHDQCRVLTRCHLGAGLDVRLRVAKGRRDGDFRSGMKRGCEQKNGDRDHGDRYVAFAIRV